MRVSEMMLRLIPDTRHIRIMYYNLRDPAPIFTGYTLGSFPNF